MILPGRRYKHVFIDFKTPMQNSHVTDFYPGVPLYNWGLKEVDPTGPTMSTPLKQRQPRTAVRADGSALKTARAPPGTQPRQALGCKGLVMPPSSSRTSCAWCARTPSTWRRAPSARQELTGQCWAPSRVLGAHPRGLGSQEWGAIQPAWLRCDGNDETRPVLNLCRQ
ncbi:hypothetical protein NDU88_000526 [Pleurodeles waltl]|uniref:Uncharacterized protein n=1 Tax=Pleurodeles waltl TaxID=8319 RepID=A0AAV7MMB6_PLEWA|nr:hypothetical protein NDU88_000526 [Pleurodeles waltl]